eukprot:m.28923 g.28923  ORF g.28923 m.28923 type:complete len:232 (-) comp6103_c0_seq1:3737-4432(-)
MMMIRAVVMNRFLMHTPLPSSEVVVVVVGRRASHWVDRSSRCQQLVTLKDQHRLFCSSKGMLDGDEDKRGSSAAASQPQVMKKVEKKPLSFIERVKVFGANALLGAFTHKGGFDSQFRDLKVESIGKGVVTATLPVHKYVCNAYNTLHGGAAATLVDIVGTMALLTLDPSRPGVSLEINTTYVRAAKLNETVTITGRVLKSGGKIGFTQVDITRSSDGELVATGRHTKALA